MHIKKVDTPEGSMYLPSDYKGYKSLGGAGYSALVCSRESRLLEETEGLESLIPNIGEDYWRRNATKNLEYMKSINREKWRNKIVHTYLSSLKREVLDDLIFEAFLIREYTDMLIRFKSRVCESWLGLGGFRQFKLDTRGELGESQWVRIECVEDVVGPDTFFWWERPVTKWSKLCYAGKEMTFSFVTFAVYYTRESFINYAEYLDVTWQEYYDLLALGQYQPYVFAYTDLHNYPSLSRRRNVNDLLWVKERKKLMAKYRESVKGDK